jgi:2-oxoglutarate ferredoxin oxidoreductase subunit alpha
VSELRLLQGNEACVEGALAAGMRFFAGYPITPSTEIAERCALRLPQKGGKFIQMEDELASIAAVIGASVAGVKAMTATSGPGFSLMQENIGYASLAEIPCVIVNVQRCGPSSGLPTSPAQGDYMQARWGTHGDHPIIAISPSTVQEAYTLMIRCFNLSEKYRVPVIFLMDEIVGHLREGTEFPAAESLELYERVSSPVMGIDKHCYQVEEGEWAPRLNPFGRGERYNITGLIHDEGGFPTNNKATARALISRLLDKIDRNTEDICDAREYRMEDAEIAVVCYGGTVRSAMAAVERARAEGARVGMFRPVTVWPFPEARLRAWLPQLKGLIVAEHNHGQMLLEVERVARRPARMIGRVNGTLIPPDEIYAAIMEDNV